MNLLIFNPWWKTNKVPKKLVGKRRQIFAHIEKYLASRQILILFGLRRVGKTTLMFQLIDTLLNAKKVNPLHILYFSFDESRYEPEEIVAFYEREILKTSLSKPQKVYIFFDEIQKLNNWPDKLKLLFDLYPNVKLVISGSAAINIKQGTRESLAGRFFEFLIKPLSFDEFLEFKNLAIDKKREDFFELEIRNALEAYLKTGGFVEALNFDDEALKKYFKEGLLERLVYKDLPEVFPISSTELLNRLLQINAYKPGLYLDYKNIANDLNYDQRTITNYFYYLEYALLTQKLYNFSPNLLTSEKKLKKTYLSNTAFTLALNENVPKQLLLEQFFVNLFQARFFSRTPQKEEVDMVLTKAEKLLPVEVKLKSKIKKADLSSLLKFMVKHNLPQGVLIANDVSSTVETKNKQIKIIPYWKYWTLLKEINAYSKTAP